MKKGQVKPSNWKRALWRQFDEQLIWFIVIVCFLILVFGVKGFFSYANLINLLLSAVVIGIMAIGESLCLLVGMFDISIESTMGFSVVISALLMQDYNMHPILVIPVILIIGSLVGLFNGVFIVKLKINPFVQTLAVLVILRGLITLVTGGKTLFNLPDWYRVIGTKAVYGIPIQIFIMLGLYAIFMFFLAKTVWGRRLYASGSNPTVTSISGINYDKMVMSAFILSGVLASIAGFIFTSRVGAVFPSLGEGQIFNVFAAAVIGGISLKGGKGRLIGVLGGVLFLSLITTLIVWFEMPVMAVRALRGVIILAAVVFDSLKNRLRYRWYG